MRKIIFAFLIIFCIPACTKEKNSVLPARSFQINYFDNLFVTDDHGFLIGGISVQKYTLIKTDENFEILWSKNNFDWGNVFSSPGWESAFYTIKLIKLFQGSDGNYICIGSTSELVISMTHTTLIILLNQKGEQIQKFEFTDLETSSVIKTNDGGYILFGTKLVKLDENFNKIWEKDISRSLYDQYEITSTADGGFATTGSFQSNQVFLKKYNSSGDEVSSYTYKHNEFPFNEAGCDLVQLDDLGFLIIGRTRNLNEISDFDCQIIRTNNNGDTIWTKRFGDATDNWLDKLISKSQSEFIIQGGFNISDTKSILYKINQDGGILDSVRMAGFQKIVYSPLNYYIKIQSKDSSHINISKINPDKLFTKE